MSRARDLADSADLNFDSGTLVIDSANNRVGIGTGSPTAPLHIYSASANRPLIESNSTSQAGLILKNTDREFRILNGSSSLSVYDTTSGSEAMRIDSSGNLHIGKTATNFTVAGTTLKGDGTTQFTRDGGQVALFNRLTSDGTIIDLRKDGTTVGSIGVADSGDRIYLAGGGLEGVGIDNGANAFVPTSQVGAFKDGHLSLGRSDARFTNLYLSGGVYLGGTGAANHLDDYEEGVHVATIVCSSSGSITLSSTDQELRYTKIGNIVHVTGLLSVSSVSSPNGFFRITLPFTPIAQGGGGTGYFPAASVIPNSLSTGNIGDFVAQGTNNSADISVYFGDATSVQTDSANAVQASTNLRVSITYETSA